MEGDPQLIFAFELHTMETQRFRAAFGVFGYAETGSHIGAGVDGEMSGNGQFIKINIIPGDRMGVERGVFHHFHFLNATADPGGVSFGNFIRRHTETFGKPFPTAQNIGHHGKFAVFHLIKTHDGITVFLIQIHHQCGHFVFSFDFFRYMTNNAFFIGLL